MIDEPDDTSNADTPVDEAGAGDVAEMPPVEEAAPDVTVEEPKAENVSDSLEEMAAPETDGGGGPVDEKNADDLEAVFDVPVRVSVVLGRTKMSVANLLKMDVGAVVELDRQVGEAIDIYVNDRLVARGEIVIVEDQLGVTMTEIIKVS